jgi:hypothetical protein
LAERWLWLEAVALALAGGCVGIIVGCIGAAFKRGKQAGRS